MEQHSELPKYANVFMQLRMRKLSRYQKREHRMMMKVLAKLSRKEKRYLNDLKSTDSVALSSKGSTQTFDSIQNLLQSGQGKPTIVKTKGAVQKSLDSLKRI